MLQQAPGNATALTVSPAPLTITANDASRQVGQPNPTFSASYSGFVLGQTPSIVSGLSLSTSATANSPAGTYAIAPSGANAANYTISYVDGVLTVKPLPQSLWPAAQFAALQTQAWAPTAGSTPQVLPNQASYLTAALGLARSVGQTAGQVGSAVVSGVILTTEKIEETLGAMRALAATVYGLESGLIPETPSELLRGSRPGAWCRRRGGGVRRREPVGRPERNAA